MDMVPISTEDVGRSPEIIETIVSSCGPSLLSRSLLGQVRIDRNRPSSCKVAYSTLRARFFLLQRRANRLQTSNDIFKQQQLATRAEVALLEDELQTSRVKLYEETEQRRKYFTRTKEANDRIEDLLGKLQRYADFIRILSGISLDNPLYRAALSVMSNVEAEEALVTAIIESAKDKTSPWSRIVPAIVGPRSPENYLSAVNLTLRTRKDLRERERVCEFWKAMAKMDPENADVVTPSSSDVSEIYDDPDEHIERQKMSSDEVQRTQKITAVDDMLECLKNNISVSNSDSALCPHPLPVFENMAEWVANETKQKNSTLRSGDCVNCDFQSPAPRRLVRFELDEALISHTKSDTATSFSVVSKTSDKGNDGSGTRASALNALDELIASAELFNATEADSNSVPCSATGPISRDISDCMSESVDLIFDALAPFSNTEEDNVVEDAAPEDDYSREEIFIVKAGEDIPRLSIQHVLDQPRGRVPLSLSDFGALSSSSEYSDLSTFNHEETERLGPVNLGHSIREEKKPTSYSSSAPVSPITSKKLDGANARGESSSSSKKSQLDQAKLSLRETIVNDTRTSKARSPKKCQLLSTVKLSPLDTALSSPHKLPNRSLNDGTSTMLQSSAVTRMPQFECPSGDIPSTKDIQNRSVPSESMTQCNARKPPTTSKTVDHLEPVNPRNILLAPPTTRPPKASSHELLIEHARSLKPTLPLVSIRPKLSPSEGKVNTRLPLQTLDINSLPARHKVVGSALTPAAYIDGSSQPKAPKLSAKDLGKRRGVIMIEKVDIGPATPPVQMAIENTVIVPTTGKIELHDLPAFCPSSSRDDTDSKSKDKVNTSVYSDIILKEEPTLLNFEKADKPAVELSSSDMKPKGRPCHPKKSPPLKLSNFDTQNSEIIDTLSDSDLDSLEITGESGSDSEECSSLQRVQKEQQSEFSGSLNALPALCRALMERNDGTSENGHIDGTKERHHNDNPFEDAPHSTPVAPSQVRSKRVFAASLISATFGHRRSATLSSGSSSEHSSGLSFSSPTHSISVSRSPLFGLTKHSARSPNPSAREVTNDREILDLTESVKSVRASSTTSKHTEETSCSTNIGSHCPRPKAPVSQNSAIFSSTAQQGREGKLNQISPIHSKPSKSTSPSSTCRLPTRPKPSANHERDASPSPTHSQSKLWPSFNNSNRLPNCKPKLRCSPPATHIASQPTFNKIFQLKPRSNTINNPLPSPPRSLTSKSLATPTPSTKPRSNTVNTYSPMTRSPLSQHVMNSLLEMQPRPKNSSPFQSTQSSPRGAFPHRLAAPLTKIAQPHAKSNNPLLITQKKSASSSQSPSLRQPIPVPPTAAFMVPHKQKSSNARRPGNSVAPLIPNCPTSSNGIISPSQCRNMLRNSMSMVR